MLRKKQVVLNLMVVVALLVSLIGVIPAQAIVPSEIAQQVAPSAPATVIPSAAAPVTSSRQASQPVGPFVSEPIVPGSFDGDLRALPADMLRGRPGQTIPEEIPNRETVTSKGYDQDALTPDPVAQRNVGSGDMPDPLVTFDALNNQDNFALFGGRVNPPDTNGAVGPNHYVQTVNLVWGVYDKTGTRLFGPAKLSTLFAAAPTGTPCDSTDPGDPIVRYDSGADRWILSQFGFTSTATLVQKWECVAVSKGPDPVTSGWWTYAIPAPGDQFNDYPKLSVWPDAYYYTARMFPGSEPFFLSAYALERSAMLAGRPARYVRFDLPGIYDSPLATNWSGEAPPAGTPALIALADDVTDSIVTWQFKVDWDNPANSTLSPEYKIPVTAYTQACPGTRDCIPFNASTSTTMLDALSPRLMFNLEYRRVGSTESVWANHTITESGRTVVRWYEFRYNRVGSVITPTLYQEGTYAPTDNIWRWMASLAADKDGNMAIGYSASSPTIDPQIRYTGRLVTDTLGVLGQDEVTMTIGTGHPTTTNSRWGDYSAMTVDPVDDCTFWYTQEYYTTTTGIAGDTRPWTTRVGSFKYPSCTPLPAVGVLQGTVSDATSLAPIPYIPVEAVDSAQNRVYAGSTDASGFYSFNPLPGTYTVTAGPLPAIGYPVPGIATGVSVISGITTTQNIVLSGAPYLIEGSRSYDDSGQGNGNGYPEPGEKNVLLTEVLSNTGVTTATNVNATLTALTPGFTVVTGTATYPDIAPSSAGANLTPFAFTVDGSLACGTVGNFRKVVVATEGTYTITFALKLGIPPTYNCTFPVPNPIIASAVPTENGGNTNGNGYIEPGEDSIDTTVTLSNTGLTNIGPATNVSGTVTALTPGVTMNAASSSYPDIPANGSAVNAVPFNFAVSSSIACGAALDFGMQVTTNEGTFNRSFQLVTGQPLPTPILILTDTVEAGQGVWITSTNTPGVGFAITTEQAHSPTHSWTDSPGAQYPNGLDTSLISPVYDFTAYDNVTLDFWQMYSTEAGFDYGQVEYSTNGGTTWTVAAAYDGVQATWLNTTLDLSAGLAHKANARIRFHFIADSGVVDNGWWLDDFTLTGQTRVCNPAVLATAASLSSAQEPNKVVTETLNIQNVGYSTLNWIIKELATFPRRPLAPVADVLQNAVRRSVVTPKSTSAPKLSVSAPQATIVQDGSFEAGSPNPYWAEFSALFGTPLCNASCGGPPAYDGAWYVWFGGAGSGAAESGYVTQTVTMPSSGGATLNFYLLMGAGTGAVGEISVTLDNTMVFLATELDVPNYGGSYKLVSVDVSNFADGQPHVLQIGESDTAAGGNFNAFVDEVSINLSSCASNQDLPWLSVSPSSGTTLSQTTTPVVVTYDSTGLVDGTYTGNLCITSNDPFNPDKVVPVALTVQSYNVTLTPATAAQAGNPGQVVTYTLRLTNTGITTDTFDLAYVGNVWAVQLPVTQTTLAAGVGTDVSVQVTVPANALGGDSDDVTVTATSQGDVTKVATSTLTTTANTVYAQLAVAHLAPFANTLAGTSVTVTLDSTAVLTDFVYGESTPYLPVPTGPHLVEIFAGASATPAITANVVLSENLSYSAVAIGDGVNQPLSLLGLLDDTAPVNGSAKVRIGHLAPFSNTIPGTLADVRLQDGTPLITNVPFSLVSPYLTLPAGAYDLKITAPGGAPTLIDPLPVALASNSIQSVFATGDGSKQALGAFAWPSDQAGSFLPLATYGVTLVPPTAAQAQYVGRVVTYTLRITNTANITDAFAISSSGNLWTVGLPTTPILLAAGAGAQFNVTVSIPLTATNNLTDTVTIKATSLSDATKTTSAVLTTTAKRYIVDLPIVLR
jgi:hypothetical protein